MPGFHILALRDELLAGLERFETMTAIQEAALPAVLDGRDVMAQAKTGSGKTAAFGVGLLQALPEECQSPHSMVLCPTRELADQVAEELRSLASRMANTRIVTLVGGRPFREQRMALDQGAHIVVGTPGRVEAHLKRRTLDPRSMATVVLDEADRMLDMGFVDEVRGIVRRTPSRRQMLLFSATFPEAVAELSRTLQRNPVEVKVESLVAATQLQQIVYECKPRDRWATVSRLLAKHRPSRALIFCETRGDCDAMAKHLCKKGAKALALHGGLEQRERDDVLMQFANSSARVLVATNVAARGLDIPNMPAVVIAEVGGEPEAHIHRIGRTGRAGEPGLALTLVAGQIEEGRLQAVEELLGEKLERRKVPLASSSLDFLVPTHQTLLLLAGRKDKIRKGDVMGALVKDAGLPADAVGRIDLGTKTCAVAVLAEHAQKALNHVLKGKIKKRRIKAVLL